MMSWPFYFTSASYFWASLFLCFCSGGLKHIFMAGQRYYHRAKPLPCVQAWQVKFMMMGLFGYLSYEPNISMRNKPLPRTKQTIFSFYYSVLSIRRCNLISFTLSFASPYHKFVYEFYHISHICNNY